MTAKGLSTEERFWMKVEKTESCWLWTACIDVLGYGRLHVDGETDYAHRISFKLHKDDLPDDFDIVVDHMCHVRHCVNPEHLQLLSRAENAGKHHGNGNRRDTCTHGHDLTNPENLYQLEHKSGPQKGKPYRVCKPCNTAAKNRYRARKKALGISV